MQMVLFMPKDFYFCCCSYQRNLPHALGRKSSPSPSRATCKIHTHALLSISLGSALLGKETFEQHMDLWCPEYESGEDLPELMGFPAASLYVWEWPQLAGSVISDAQFQAQTRFPAGTSHKYRTPGSDFCSVCPQQQFLSSMDFVEKLISAPEYLKAKPSVCTATMLRDMCARTRRIQILLLISTWPTCQIVTLVFLPSHLYTIKPYFFQLHGTKN